MSLNLARKNIHSYRTQKRAVFFHGLYFVAQHSSEGSGPPSRAQHPRPAPTDTVPLGVTASDTALRHPRRVAEPCPPGLLTGRCCISPDRCWVVGKGSPATAEDGDGGGSIAPPQNRCRRSRLLCRYYSLTESLGGLHTNFHNYRHVLETQHRSLAGWGSATAAKTKRSAFRTGRTVAYPPRSSRSPAGCTSGCSRARARGRRGCCPPRPPPSGC